MSCQTAAPHLNMKYLGEEKRTRLLFFLAFNKWNLILHI